MRKKRGYKRETPQELVRDYRLFAIVCEGSQREPGYFSLFQYLSPRIAVDIIEEKVNSSELEARKSKKSAPRWLVDRAMLYIEKEGLHEDDSLWFVMDIDRWPTEQLHEISQHCAEHPNWHVVLSNPCFEVWLCYHQLAGLAGLNATSSQEFKTLLDKLDKGGYHPLKYIPLIKSAISNAKAMDSNPESDFPEFKETKVYQLGESLLTVAGINAYDDFIRNTIPELIKNHNKKTQIKATQRKIYRKKKE